MDNEPSFTKEALADQELIKHHTRIVNEIGWALALVEPTNESLFGIETVYRTSPYEPDSVTVTITGPRLEELRAMIRKIDNGQ